MSCHAVRHAVADIPRDRVIIRFPHLGRRSITTAPTETTAAVVINVSKISEVKQRAHLPRHWIEPSSVPGQELTTEEQSCSGHPPCPHQLHGAGSRPRGHRGRRGRGHRTSARSRPACRGAGRETAAA